MPKDRVKPWGTSHAILSAKKYVNEAFTVINADDFYGYEPFKKIKDFFEKNFDEIIATTLEDEKNTFIVDKNTLVSMNFFGFRPNVFNYLQDEMVDFFNNHKNDLDKCEFLIPTSIFKRIEEEKISVKVLDTKEKWFGVTYKEDKKDLVEAINKMISEGKYPKNLWS